jgi:DGQHR domain-containing protein
MKKVAKKRAVKDSSEKIRLSFPAISVEQAEGTNFWISSIPSSKLFSLSKISRADEDPKRGYQRLLDEKRAKRIAKYFDDGGAIPGSIILSAQNASGFQFDKNTNTISFYVHKGAFVVIDGQHRLYGASFAQRDIPLPVAIFSGLDLEDEVQYFVDVNGEQKGVPRTLRLEIIKFLTPDEHPEQIRVRLFHELANRPNSPLCNRMSPTRSIVGKLSHVAFKSAISPILDLPAVKRMSFEQKTQILINFLSAIEDLLIETRGDSKKLSNAAFFQAVFDAFPAVIQMALERHNNYKITSFSDVLEPMKELDLDAYAGTNKEAISALANKIKEILNQSESVSNEMF